MKLVCFFFLLTLDGMTLNQLLEKETEKFLPLAKQ